MALPPRNNFAKLPPRPGSLPPRPASLVSPPPAKPIKPAEQPNLFDVPETWAREWQGMPEFVQKEQKPFGTIHVHFNNYEDMVEFGVKIGHKVNAETKFLWYPQIDIKSVKHKRWVDNVHTDDCQCETCLLAFNPQPAENEQHEGNCTCENCLSEFGSLEDRYGT